MEGNFSRTVGPKADVAELEYVAALHQTSAATRPTGTASSLDILRFLKSRHSLEISHAQAKDIVTALGGGSVSKEVRVNVAAAVAGKMRTQARQATKLTHRDRWRSLKGSFSQNQGVKVVEKDPISLQETNIGLPSKEHLDRTKFLIEEILSPTILYLDIVQLTSVILIPTIARMAKQWEASPHPNLVWQKPSGAKSVDDPMPNIDQNRSHGALSGQSDDGMLQYLYTVWGKNKDASEDEVHSVTTNPQEDSIQQREDPSVHELSVHDDSARQGNEQPLLFETSRGNAHSQTQKPLTEDDSLSPQPLGLLELVLHSMWAVIRDDSNNDDLTTNLGGPPTVSPQVIRALLIENGEMERVNDPNLIQRMIEVAQSSDNPGRLDERALLHALTADLQDWDVGSEDRQTTYVYDIFGRSTLKSFDRLGKDNSYRQQLHGPKSSAKEISHEGHTGYVGESATKDTMHPQADSIKEVEQESENPKQTSLPTNSQEDTMNGSAMDTKQTVMSDPRSVTENFVELTSKKSVMILDTVVDSYASTVTLLLTWMTFIGHTGTYASLMLQMDAFTVKCTDETFGCTLGVTVVSWVMAALLLTLFGFVVLVPLSYGNHPTKREPGRMLLATFMTTALTVTPLCVLLYYNKEDSDEFPRPVKQLIDSQSFHAMIYLTTILGSILAINYFLHFAIGMSRKYGYIPAPGGWIDLFSTTSHVVGTARTKKAATRKVNKLLTNARDMHGLTESLAPTPNTSMSFRKSQSDTVFQKYTLCGEGFEDAGSFLWVWERIFTAELFHSEGIWLPARLIIFQFGQIAIAFLILFLLFFFVEKVAKAADDAQSTLKDGLPIWFYDFVPTGEEVRWALIPAASVSVTVCVTLTLLYIPSTVKTILKYRCGQLSALGDRTFHLARKGPDAAYMNTANAIYGMLAAAVLFFFLIGLLLFLFVWDFSRPIVLLILAWGIGLAITIGIKVIMTSFCRKRFFRAFYRIYPGRANLTTLALECWFIGLGGGVLIGRITQFLLASAFWIGRIDEPLLADNVALMGYRFDYVPLHYVKELLVHEAHRHPYIERLGAMYLMRLRYKSFANSDACACWRQLFVLTLLPWLMKYRVFEEQRGVESLRDQESERQVQVDEDREVLAEMAGEIMGATVNFAGIVDQGARKVGQVGLEAVDAGAQFLHV